MYYVNDRTCINIIIKTYYCLAVDYNIYTNTLISFYSYEKLISCISIMIYKLNKTMMDVCQTEIPT